LHVWISRPLNSKLFCCFQFGQLCFLLSLPPPSQPLNFNRLWCQLLLSHPNSNWQVQETRHIFKVKGVFVKPELHFIALHICYAFNTFNLKSVKYFEKANLDFRVISNIDLNSYSFLLQNISKLESWKNRKSKFLFITSLTITLSKKQHLKGFNLAKFASQMANLPGGMWWAGKCQGMK